MGLTPTYKRFNKGDTPPDPNCSCPAGKTIMDLVLPYFVDFGRQVREAGEAYQKELIAQGKWPTDQLILGGQQGEE